MKLHFSVVPSETDELTAARCDGTVRADQRALSSHCAALELVVEEL